MKQMLKVFLGFVAFFIVYCLAIAVFPDPRIKKYQSQWDENTGKAQAFLFSTGSAPIVVLAGSSLSARIPESGCVANLALIGGAAIDSLRLLESSGRIPRLVFIETNEFARPADPEFLRSINGVLPRTLRVLRIDAKPINYLLSSLYSLTQEGGPGTTSALLPRPDSRLRDIGLAVQNRTYETLIERSTLDRQASVYEAALARLNDQKVKIVFVELPVHKSLRELPRARQTRVTVKDAFPGYEYLNLGDLEDFREVETTDGTHLTPSEALAASSALLKKARELLHAPNYCT